MNVYREYNQEQLDRQFNVRLHVPGYNAYFERWEKLSRQTEKEFTHLKDVCYASHPLECLDIYPAKHPLSKTLIFIHGGYWHLLDKSMFHFLAGHFLHYNVTTVFINYPLAPEASIDTIVVSCRQAIGWLHNNIIRFNGDPAQLYVMGHSAGGHLAAMLLAEADANLFQGVITLSGLFRLEPIMHSYLNDVLHIDAATAIKNSPVLLERAIACPMLLATGTNETEEFIIQSKELYDRWKSNNKNVELLTIADKNHYSIVDAVIETDSALASAIIRLMKIER